MGQGTCQAAKPTFAPSAVIAPASSCVATSTIAIACGVEARVITPVGTLKWDGGSVSGPATDAAGPLTLRSGDLVDIQYGRADDAFGWMHRVC